MDLTERLLAAADLIARLPGDDPYTVPLLREAADAIEHHEYEAALRTLEIDRLRSKDEELLAFLQEGEGGLRDRIEALTAEVDALNRTMDNLAENVVAANDKAYEAVALLRDLTRCYLALALADPPKPVSEHLPLIHAQHYLARTEGEQP